MHLWHSRRCAVRLKAELTAAVYDKALRRKDASGVVAAKPEDEAAEGDKKDTKDKGKGKEKKEEKKTNADSGKIVNLMAGTYISVRICRQSRTWKAKEVYGHMCESESKLMYR